MLSLVRECIFYVVLQEATTKRIFFTSYCKGAINNECLFSHIARSDNDDNIVMLYLKRSNDIYTYGDARSDSNCIFHVILGGSKQRNNSTIVRCKDATIKYFACCWLQWWWQHEYFFGRIARQTARNLFALCVGELQQACQPRQVMAFFVHSTRILPTRACLHHHNTWKSKDPRDSHLFVVHRPCNQQSHRQWQCWAAPQCIRSATGLSKVSNGRSTSELKEVQHGKWVKKDRGNEGRKHAEQYNRACRKETKEEESLVAWGYLQDMQIWPHWKQLSVSG